MKNEDKYMTFRLTYKEFEDLMKMLEIGKYRYNLGQKGVYERLDYIYKNWTSYNTFL